MAAAKKRTPGESGQANAEQTTDTGIVSAGCVKSKPATMLAARINAEHAAAHADAHKAMQRVRKCGELLMQAKAQTPHGEWVQWIEVNLTFGARQAQKYIRLAESWERVANANSDSLLPSIDAALATVAEPREASAKASKPHTKAKPIRVGAVEVPASRVQIVLDELDRPEAFTPERTAHAVALVREMLTTGDAKTASIEQVAAMRHPPPAAAAPPDLPAIHYRTAEPVAADEAAALAARDAERAALPDVQVGHARLQEHVLRGWREELDYLAERMDRYLMWAERLGNGDYADIEIDEISDLTFDMVKLAEEIDEAVGKAESHTEYEHVEASE